MKNIRLYIGGKRADLDGSLNIPFTYQTSDSQMPTAVKNSYSKTVTLQGTEQNRRIFDGLWRLDSRVKDVKAREPEYIADYTESDAEFTSRAVPSAASAGNLVKVTSVKGNSAVVDDTLVANAAMGVEMRNAEGAALGNIPLNITGIVPSNQPTLTAVNLVPNGDFSNGVAGWSNYYGISFAAANNTMTLTFTSATFRGMAQRAFSATIPSGHRYYYAYRMKITTATTWSTLRPLLLLPGAQYPYTLATTAFFANWRRMSGTMVANYDQTQILVGTYNSNSGNTFAIGDTIEIQSVVVVDLTALFGAGNEPTADEFEALVGTDYFTTLTFANKIFPEGMAAVPDGVDEWSGTTATRRVAHIRLDGRQEIQLVNWRATGTSVGFIYPYAMLAKAKYIRPSVSTTLFSNIQVASYDECYRGTYDHCVGLFLSGVYSLAVRLPDTTLTTKPLINAYLAEHPIDLYFEIATEQTFTTSALPSDYVDYAPLGTQVRLPEGSSLAPFVGSFEYGHIQTYPLPYHFNPMKRVPFLLYVDEMVVERGYCQLVAINRKSRGYTFSLSLFGGLGEFFYNLQTDSEGETKSLADLDFGQDLGFTINAAKVQEVWDDLIAGNLPTIGFVPMHNGAPASVDGKKALIKGGGLPTSIVDGSDTYSQKLGYILASLERKYTEWEIGDLRSYLQRPALRFKDFLAAVCNPANNGGWTVNLDSGFFNEDNPYYEKTYLLLPQLNVEESTDEICDDGSVEAVSDYPTTATKVKTLQPVSSCLTLDGTYIDLSGSASNAYVKVSLPIQLAVTGLTNQGDLYLTNRVSHHTENKTICMMAAAYDEDGSLLAVSNRYVFTSKSHRNETGDVKKPAAPVATTDAQIDGYFTYQGGEYVFRTDDNAANIFALVIDKIPRPSSNAHKIQIRFYIQMTTDGIPTLNTKRKGENSSNVNVSNTQFSCRLLSGSNNNVSLVEPTQYASDSRVSQEALLNSLEQSPLEILLSYTKTFGLMWIQDNLQNSVSLYKRENYYTGEVSDIHNRIDYGKGWKATPVSAESNNYTLENEYPETTLSKAYESDYGRTYGGVRLKVGYDFGKEKIETMEKVELKGYVEGALSGSGYWKYRNADGNLPSPIADGMKVTYYKESGGETQTKDVEYNLFNVTAITKTNSPALGVACLNEDGEEKAVEVAPALVMLQGGAMGGTFYLSDDVAAMATLNNGPCWIWDESRSAARIPRFARVATFDGETYSLDFGTPRMTYYIPEVSLAPEQAVYARYWERYLTDLLDRNTKKVECYVVFPPHLDMRQEMRKFYLFDRTLWVLNKVTDYDATKEASVKCEFIRVNLKGNYVNE